MSKLKLMTIIGTRPEIIRLAAVIKRCDRYFDQILVHTGQNYDYTLNQVFFDDLGLRAPVSYTHLILVLRIDLRVGLFQRLCKDRQSGCRCFLHEQVTVMPVSYTHLGGGADDRPGEL